MIKLFYNPSQILTMNTNGKNFKRGSEINEISPLYHHSIVVEDELIKDIIPNNSIILSKYDIIYDLRNKILMPGLIDCHTHTVYAGSRADEFIMKLQGKSYEDIAQKGGGILSTVNAIENITPADLYNISLDRIKYFISQGITTLEIKSGYGLSFDNEIKILNVIRNLNQTLPIDIIPTFLGAHTYPKEYKNDHKKYIEILLSNLTPFIINNKLATFFDIFCEQTAFSPDEVDYIFSNLHNTPFKLKMHSEQFNSIGGLDIGLKHNVHSIDHLEVITEQNIQKLASSNTVAVVLPGCSFFLNYDFAPAKKIIENNGILAIASDYNPGSNHINNISMLMGIAAIKMNLTPEQILNAWTINAAKALDISDKFGSIEPNKFADFAIFDTTNYNEIIYNMGNNLISKVFKKGELIYNKK